ncbi:MAG: hypothetical protein ACO3RK_05070 [Luteolibacter sp.]
MEGFLRAKKVVIGKIFPLRHEMSQLFPMRGVQWAAVMKQNSHNAEVQSSQESWESDPVWKLLDARTAPKAGPRLVERTLRAARMTTQRDVWWKSWRTLFAPAPLAGLGTAAALAALTFAFLPTSPTAPITHEFVLNAEAEEIPEIDYLIASIDEIDELSDSELIALIGY